MNTNQTDNDTRTNAQSPGLESRHTPGPWITDDKTVNHGPIIIQRNGALEVAAVYGDGREQRAANARLIAAAPELLAALSETLPFVLSPNLESWAFIESGRRIDRDAAIIKARAAIAKSKEVQP